MVTQLKFIASSNVSPSYSGNVPNIDNFSMSSAADSITYLYSVLANSRHMESLSYGVGLFLEAGRRKFNTDVALITRPISTQVYEVIACSDDQDRFYVGQHLSQSGSLCEQVIIRNETTIFSNLANSDVQLPNMAYNGFKTTVYLGTVVRTENTSNSVMCFLSSESPGRVYSEEDSAFITLLAEGVACMTDQQKAQAQRKLTDQAIFALGSVKTLDEYLDQARLPEVFGVPARVVEVLEKRIGHAPLSIGHVAEDLNLSKRTLQRRLQQQDISFAELRDQVRFHYSIDYLVKQHLSIDSISASLDFSDRTSFTNAFKRWTGLSPSTFRKLFRDYV